MGYLMGYLGCVGGIRDWGEKVYLDILILTFNTTFKSDLRTVPYIFNNELIYVSKDEKPYDIVFHRDNTYTPSYSKHNNKSRRLKELCKKFL
jgi:hypothetical protein